MGMIKNRNVKDLTEEKEIKKRWQEYTEELYKEGLNVLNNHDGLVTYLESDILECEVKWALESITTNKTTGGDGIPAKLLQILKNDAVKVLHWVYQQIWKTAVATGLEKVSFHSNPKEGQCQTMFRLPDICALFHMLAKLCSKSFKLGFSSTWTENFQMHKLGLEKAEEPQIKLPTSIGS